MHTHRPSSPAASSNSDPPALLSTHAIPHSASEPSKLASAASTDSVQDSAALNAHGDNEHKHDSNDRTASAHRVSLPSPPALSNTDHDAFAALRPTPSSDREVAAYTAAASARGRNLDQHGNFADFDPNRRSSAASSSASPVTLIKNLPDAATKTLTSTIAAPARTLDSIKSKLQAQSTDRKSKSEIPDSLGQVERDMRYNRDARGRLSPIAASFSDALDNKTSADKPGKSSSFNSLLSGKSKRSNPVSALMQRGPGKNKHSSSHAADPRRMSSAISDDAHEGITRNDGPRAEEEEEDEELIRQRIKDQQKRLEDFDQAQTIGLLRTQQEAGIEPPQSPTSPTKSSWLVALPLFGSGKGKHDDAGYSDGRQKIAENDAGLDNDKARERGRKDSPRRTNSEKVRSVTSRSQSRGRQAVARSASASRATRSRSRPRKGDQEETVAQRGSDGPKPPRRQSTTWTSKLRTKIPIKEFPLQGSGRESEFNQERPLWARQPWKYLYFSYFGLSVGLYHLPSWAISSIFPSKRGRPDWSWKKATMVKLYRHGTQLTFRTRTSLGRDLQKEVPHSKTVRCKFTWVDPVGDDDVRGELRRAMLMQKVQPQRTCGFWYGDVAELAKATRHAKHHHHHGSKLFHHGHNHAVDQGEGDRGSASASNDDTPMHEGVVPSQGSNTSLGGGSRRAESGEPNEAMGGVGRPAEPGEKVLYHLHGGAYWIGTAHEKDVTAAVNTESLRYMAEIYKAKEADQADPSPANASARNGASKAADGAVPTSSSDSMSGSTSTASSSPYQGKLLRSFSLDYRLCVPGRPRAGSYPAALLDALSGYLYLTRDLGFNPENVIVAGDSAGGNLALSLCRYLRDEREQVAKQPGALLLMSPWVDISRSHAGPTGAPNLDSTVYTNQKSDIISSLIAFRNTAVSAFLGDLPARETYRNPYISPVSLQLPLERGGKGPQYGFHGFPKKVYITTGSAEISYDQHLTLAHRLSSGTRKGRPIYSGDRLSAGCNAREMAERRDRPRPKEMLDADQNDLCVTPMQELQGMDLQVDGHQTQDDPQQFVEQTIDGEPRASSHHSEGGEEDGTPLGNHNLDEPQSQGNSTSNGGAEDGAKNAKARLAAFPPPEPAEKEEREVILDEVKDAVHDYLLFKWFEPERSCTWRRIAQWIDEV